MNNNAAGSRSGERALHVGPVRIDSHAFLAPMSGVTDRPFRRLAARFGAGLVVSEMIGGRVTAAKAEERRLRADGEGIALHMVQIVGNEAPLLAEAARIAEGAGAAIIDINMGCPAKRVTRGHAGSTLMRDPDNAIRLVEAVVQSTDRPVTVKMRLGWDDAMRNAPEIAARAEAVGIHLVTVHGRTRCQFFTGRADWAAISEVKARVSIPVVANGDLADPNDAARMLALSGADAVMIGRGAYGRPWVVGETAAVLAGRKPEPAPAGDHLIDLVLEHYLDTLRHHGDAVGVRLARKHLAWFLDRNDMGPAATRERRLAILRADEPRRVVAELGALRVGALPCAA